MDGEPILALPLSKARTSNRALAQLRSSEAALNGERVVNDKHSSTHVRRERPVFPR